MDIWLIRHRSRWYICYFSYLAVLFSMLVSLWWNNQKIENKGGRWTGFIIYKRFPLSYNYNLFTIYSVREFQYLVHIISLTLLCCVHIIFFSSNSGPIYEVGSGVIWGLY